jgi:vacuolar-type H+-ATPase subunit D/Vma8
LRVENGENLYKDGQRKRAKEEFDSALDLILDVAATHPKETRLERALSELAARVNAIELAALRQGEGLIDETDQPRSDR